MIKTKPWVGGTDEEYASQYFGFGAERFKIAVRQMAEQKIPTCLKDMQNYLQEALDLNEKDTATLTNSCHKLIKLYCERAGPSLDAIDDEIEKVITVPPHVLLPGDEIQETVLSDAEYEKLKEDVALMRKRVERGALMEALLNAEEDELNSIEAVYDVAKKDMEVLDTLFSSSDTHSSIKALQSDTMFVCASLPFMKEAENNCEITDLFDDCE